MQRKLKDKILELFNQGYDYMDIVYKLKCSSSVVSYHLYPEQRLKALARGKDKLKTSHPIHRKIYAFLANYTYKKRKCNLLVGLKKKVRGFQMRTNDKLTDNKFTVEELLIKLGDNPRCYLTGTPIDLYDFKSYQLDHVIPRSKGGDSSLENANICLAHVNKAKNNLSVDEFIEMCKSVVEHNKNKE